MPARLGVVITMYNSAATIAETIASLRNQSFEDWECVVVNDGSKDDGPRIVEALTRAEPRLSMVTQENRGLAGARNRGIDEAADRGWEWLHFLDSDDWMRPRGLEWLFAAAQETGASYGGYELCDESGASLGRQSPVSAPLVGLDEQIEWNRTATHAHLFRREAIGESRFDERLKVVEDYDMWLRLAAKGVVWKGVERVVCAYRLRRGSMSKDFRAMVRCYEQVVRRAFDEARGLGWEKRGVDLSDKRFARVVGNMALANATMDALVDPLPGKNRAAEFYAAAARPERVSAGAAAQAACTGLLFGACTAPEINGRSEQGWAHELRKWWVRCAEEGWLQWDQIDAAFFELARKVVHPDLIADRMLDRCGVDRGGSIVVVGMERNGRRLARQAAARGWKALVFDDFSGAREADLLEELPGVEKVRDVGELGRRIESSSADRAGPRWAPWVVGPMDAKGLDAAERSIGACGGAAKILRWGDQREKLGAANWEHLRRALDGVALKAG